MEMMTFPTLLQAIEFWEILGIGVTLLISGYLIFELLAAVLKPGRRSPHQADRRLPFVSVVIPIYDEPEEIIRGTLNSWEQVRYPSFELILADDSPIPVDIGKARTRVIRRTNRDGFKGGALRNAFSQLHPSSEWMLVFDADYLVEPDVLVRFAEHYQPGVGGIQGLMVMGRNKQRSYLVRFSEALHEVAGTLLSGRYRHRGFVGVQGTVQAYRVEAIRSMGGIAPEFTANEDLDTTFRLRKAGWKIVYDPEIVGRGVAPETYSAFFAQITRWTATTVREYRRHMGTFFRSPNVPRAEKVDSLLFLLTWTNALIVAPTYLFLPWALLFVHVIPLWLAIAISLLPAAVFMIPTIARGSARLGLAGWLWYYVLLLPGSVVMFRASLQGIFTEPGFQRTPKGTASTTPESRPRRSSSLTRPGILTPTPASAAVRTMTCTKCRGILSQFEVLFYAVAALDVPDADCRRCLGHAESVRFRS